jgi:hypothetical protein
MSGPSTGGILSARAGAESVPTMCARTDYWRRSPALRGGRAGHKEWSYFCVFARDLELLANFSLMDDSRAAQKGGPEAARVVLLACEGGRHWDGDVDQCTAAELRAAAGTGNARFGASSITFSDGCYHLDARLRNRRVSARLRLRPLVAPAIASSVRLSTNGAMRWLVVPRLSATGTVDVGDRHYVLEDCLAYHDRNWGYFNWGSDFSWEWATILPHDASDPWSMVYMRISDRFRHRTFSQGLIVWRGDAASRTFDGRHLEARQRGLLRQEQVLRVPRITRLAAPGQAADVPQCLDLTSAAGGDRLEIVVELGSAAQLAVPNDGQRGLTLLSEATGHAEVHGSIRGEKVAFRGRAIAEFNHAAP